MHRRPVSEYPSPLGTRALEGPEPGLATIGRRHTRGDQYMFCGILEISHVGDILLILLFEISLGFK